MKKRIYVLRSKNSIERSGGVFYYNYFIVYPGHKHAYNYTMSEEGFIQLIMTLRHVPDMEVKELPWSEDKNLWTMINEHEESLKVGQADFQSA